MNVSPARLASAMVRRPPPAPRGGEALALDISVDELHDATTARRAVRLGSLALGAFLVWAALAPVHELAVGTGRILPAGFVQQVQHLEGGIVEEILVAEGDVVEKGQVLVRLTDLAVRAELTKAQARLEALSLEIGRRKVHDQEPVKVFEGELNLRRIVDSQRSADAAESIFQQARGNVIRAEIAIRRTELQNLQEQRLHLGEELDILAAQLADYEVALSKEAISRRERDEVKRAKIRLESELLAITGQEATTSAALLEAEARLAELDASFRHEAETAVAELETARAEALEAVAQLSDRLQRLVVRAPEAGTVHTLAVRNAGQVASPGGLVAEIVPADSALFAEVEISADRIGTITRGMKANVKILTFDYTRFGELKGTVSDVSPSSFSRDDGGLPYYRVRITLDQSYIGDAAAKRRITAGMSVSADILLGEKSVLSYLLKPLRAISDHAFTEQ